MSRSLAIAALGVTYRARFLSPSGNTETSDVCLTGTTSTGCLAELSRVSWNVVCGIPPGHTYRASLQPPLWPYHLPGKRTSSLEKQGRHFMFSFHTAQQMLPEHHVGLHYQRRYQESITSSPRYDHRYLGFSARLPPTRH